MEKDVKYWYLRNHQLFSRLSSDEIKELCVITNFRKARKNEIIDLADEHKRIYSLKKGTIRIISISEDGTETTKEILQQGDIFGEISLDANNAEAENQYAQAASPEVQVCSFFVEDFEKILHRNPLLAIHYTKLVGFRLKTMQNRYADLVFKDVRTRLISFLKDFAVQNGKKEANSFVTPHFLTQHDIANLIGASRQTVTTLMNEFTEQNLFQYSRNTFIIPDVEKFK
ncbi:MAG: Crp/Fnr family transcriptional regulator [Verrucomicrobia bacterium]|nr:Crp/Fnr family transcriptional regulator [Cytophagales bacterium]